MLLQRAHVRAAGRWLLLLLLLYEQVQQAACRGSDWLLQLRLRLRL